MFLELLKKYQQQYGIKLLSYVLLPDHLHLLLEMTGEGEQISGFMHDLNNSYTKYFNGRYERKGHLFQGRFKAAVVEKVSNLTKLTAYMHLNPQRLNLISDAKEYQYSSYGDYLSPGRKTHFDLELAINEVLSLLRDRGYAEFVKEFSREEGYKLHKKLQRGGIVGSDEFVKKVKEEIDSYQSITYAGAGGKQPRYRLFILTATFLVVLVAGIGGVYFYFIAKEKGMPEDAQQMVVGAMRRIEELNGTEWEIRLTPTTQGEQRADTISFTQGKFVSAKLNTLEYTPSNYSLTIEDSGKITWETMQTSPDGTASWRGEIEQGKMRGILSLRSKEVPRSPERSEGSEVEGRQKDTQPQDFSFMSIRYRRKE